MKNYALMGILGLFLATSVQAGHNKCNQRNSHRRRVERVEVHRNNRYTCRPNRRVHREVHVYNDRCRSSRRRHIQRRRVVHRPVCSRRRRTVVHVNVNRPCPPRQVIVYQPPRRQVEVVHTYPSETAYDQVGRTHGQVTTTTCGQPAPETVVIHKPSRDKVRRRNAFLIAGAANEIFNKGERRQRDIRKGAIAATILNEILTR